MGEKVTDMVLKVDLQCPCFYKKVKKILCKFPQIRDQIFDEKANTVRITVVCCDPEKVRDKLRCKGCKVIKSIEIVEPPKLPVEKKESPKPERTCCVPCSEGHCGGPYCYYRFGVAPPPRPCHVTRCDYYFCEENPQSCSIM